MGMISGDLRAMVTLCGASFRLAYSSRLWEHETVVLISSPDTYSLSKKLKTEVKSSVAHIIYV
jgi:hypothetical protein